MLATFNMLRPKVGIWVVWAFIFLLTLFSFCDFKLFFLAGSYLELAFQSVVKQFVAHHPEERVSRVPLSSWCTGTHVSVLVPTMIGIRFA